MYICDYEKAFDQSKLFLGANTDILYIYVITVKDQSMENKPYLCIIWGFWKYVLEHHFD